MAQRGEHQFTIGASGASCGSGSASPRSSRDGASTPPDHHAVDALLAEYGTPRPSTGRARGSRYERSRPDALWHIDIKGPFWLQRAPGVPAKVYGRARRDSTVPGPGPGLLTSDCRYASPMPDHEAELGAIFEQVAAAGLGKDGQDALMMALVEARDEGA